MAERALVDDGAQSVPNGHYVENRHDQSLLSMLVKANAPIWERGGPSHVNAASSASERSPTAWRGDVAARHAEFGVRGLRVVVLRDCGWPVTGGPGQPIAAARLAAGPQHASGGSGCRWADCM